MSDVVLKEIELANKHKHKQCKHCIYIGRPGALGNMYSHMDDTKAQYKVATCDEAVAKYHTWLREEYKKQDREGVYGILNGLCDMYESGQQIHLLCWCTPLACHGDIIKKAILGIHAQREEERHASR